MYKRLSSFVFICVLRLELMFRVTFTLRADQLGEALWFGGGIKTALQKRSTAVFARRLSLLLAAVLCSWPSRTSRAVLHRRRRRLMWRLKSVSQHCMITFGGWFLPYSSIMSFLPSILFSSCLVVTADFVASRLLYIPYSFYSLHYTLV